MKTTRSPTLQQPRLLLCSHDFGLRRCKVCVRSVFVSLKLLLQFLRELNLLIQLADNLEQPSGGVAFDRIAAAVRRRDNLRNEARSLPDVAGLLGEDLYLLIPHVDPCQLPRDVPRELVLALDKLRVLKGKPPEVLGLCAERLPRSFGMANLMLLGWSILIRVVGTKTVFMRW